MQNPGNKSQTVDRRCSCFLLAACGHPALPHQETAPVGKLQEELESGLQTAERTEFLPYFQATDAVWESLLASGVENDGFRNGYRGTPPSYLSFSNMAVWQKWLHAAAVG